MCREQPQANFRQSQVWFSLHKGQKPVFMSLHGFRFVVSAARQGGTTARRGKPADPPDNGTDPNPELTGRTSAGQAALHRGDNTFPKIVGIGGRHRSLSDPWQGQIRKLLRFPKSLDRTIRSDRKPL